MAINPLRNILNKRSIKTPKGAEILLAPLIKDSDSDFIPNFLRMSDVSLSEAGEELNIRLRLTHDYFLEKKVTLARIFQLYPGTYNLIYQFIGIHRQKKTVMG